MVAKTVSQQMVLCTTVQQMSCSFLPEVAQKCTSYTQKKPRIVGYYGLAVRILGGAVFEEEVVLEGVGDTFVGVFFFSPL